MYSLLKKEIIAFFSSLTGYIVIIVFLAANSLLLWIIPGNYNIFDIGYASLEPFFEISPWVFLFLVSAVSMKMIAEEKRLGTFDLLLSKPLSETQIILAKYFAIVTLVLISIIPTIIFFFSLYFLGNPVGNIDGGTAGSYIGLFFLASIYAAIGLFASSLTDNQIIAFVLSVILSLIMYIGFDAITSLNVFYGHEYFISQLGINEHYKSISRGVIDLKDVVYFLSAAALFLVSTRTVIQSRRW